MKEKFSEITFREYNYTGNTSGKNLIKANMAENKGKCKITVEEESDNGIKIVLKKDENDNIQEIKFVCSCGQTKTVQLNYSE